METEVINFLNRYHTGVLCTGDSSGVFQACSIFYVCNLNTTQFAFKSRRMSEHSQALAKNPNAALAIYDHSSDYFIKSGIQIRGEVAAVDNEQELRQWVELYSNKFDGSAEKFEAINSMLNGESQATIYRFTPHMYKFTNTSNKRADLEYTTLT